MSGNAYEDTVHSFEEFKQRRDGGDGKKFDLISLADLLELPDPTYSHLVADMLPSGGTSIIVAKPKVGKTTLAQQLARCVAGGTPFLGREVRTGSVIYLAFEEKQTEVKKSFRLAESLPEWKIYFHFGEPPEDKFNLLRALIDEHQPGLVIIDTLAHWMGLADFNDYGQVGAALRPLHTMARDVTAHIMCVHHSGKGGGRSESIDSPLGSTALAANVDTIMVLSEGDSDNERILETRQRYGEHLPRTVLTFEKERRTFTDGGTVRDGRRREIEDEIVAVLSNGSMTEVALRTYLKCQKDRLMRALDILVSSSIIVRSGTGLRGQAFQYFLSPTYSHAQSQTNDKKNEDDYPF